MMLIYGENDFKIGDKVSMKIDESFTGMVTGIVMRSINDYMLIVTYLNGTVPSEAWVRPYEVVRVK